MFEFIKSAVIPATETEPMEYLITAKNKETEKVFTFFKKYTTNGVVADDEGNIFTEGEIFEAVKGLTPEPTLTPKPEKPKVVKKKATAKAKKK